MTTTPAFLYFLCVPYLHCFSNFWLVRLAACIVRGLLNDIFLNQVAIWACMMQTPSYITSPTQRVDLCYAVVIINNMSGWYQWRICHDYTDTSHVFMTHLALYKCEHFTSVVTCLTRRQPFREHGKQRPARYITRLWQGMSLIMFMVS